MFDPTVFDNLKVVVEGALYDLDLEGSILITDRTDEVELAKLSRHYRISFTTREQFPNDILAYLDLKMDIANLSAELQSIPNSKPGCRIEVGFILDIHSIESCSQYEKVLKEIWGETRQIQQEISFIYNENKYNNNIKILFNRLMYEDQVDDLLEMIDYLIHSIQQLNNV